MEKMSIIYEALLGYHADIVIDEALRRFREQRLYEEIDEALSTGNESKFLRLTEELKTLKYKELSNEIQ